MRVYNMYAQKSTTGLAAFLGTHLLRTTANTQSVVATSADEAGYYAIVSAASVLIGLKSMLADIGVPVNIKLGCDTAAGMRCESGLDKTIDVKYLWVHRALADGLVTVEKVDAEINPSAMMAKNLSGARVSKLMGLLGFKYLNGLSPLALRCG